MSTPAERVQRFLDNYEGTEIITSVRRLPPGRSCPVPLHLADLRALLNESPSAANTFFTSDLPDMDWVECPECHALPGQPHDRLCSVFTVVIDPADGTW